MTLGRAQAQPYIMGLLALLAMIGLFNLFAFAAGIIRFAERGGADDPIMRAIADHAFDGLAVTDSGGHVVYANAAYLALTGAATAAEVRPVERVFIGNPDVSEAVFRLLKAAREGKRQQEEVRIAGTDAATAAGFACACARWGKASVRQNTRCGRSRTSRATASGRKMCFRNCSTPSIISTMRRAGSSRSMRRATSSISTPRSQTGSIRILRKSAPAD